MKKRKEGWQLQELGKREEVFHGGFKSQATLAYTLIDCYFQMDSIFRKFTSIKL